MVRVMDCPAGTEVRGVNTRTGAVGLPETPPEVIDVKAVISVAAVMMTVLRPAVKPAS